MSQPNRGTNLCMIRHIPLAIFLLMLTTVSAAAQLSRPGAGLYDVTSFVAFGDGKTKDTAAFQNAIDAASRDGDGIHHAPHGRAAGATRNENAFVACASCPGASRRAFVA